MVYLIDLLVVMKIYYLRKYNIFFIINCLDCFRVKSNDGNVDKGDLKRKIYIEVRNLL